MQTHRTKPFVVIAYSVYRVCMFRLKVMDSQSLVQIFNLPSDVTSAESLTTFCQRLKTHLFSKSFPGYFLDIN